MEELRIATYLAMWVRELYQPSVCEIFFECLSNGDLLTGPVRVAFRLGWWCVLCLSLCPKPICCWLRVGLLVLIVAFARNGYPRVILLTQWLRFFSAIPFPNTTVCAAFSRIWDFCRRSASGYWRTWCCYHRLRFDWGSNTWFLHIRYYISVLSNLAIATHKRHRKPATSAQRNRILPTNAGRGAAHRVTAQPSHRGPISTISDGNECCRCLPSNYRVRRPFHSQSMSPVRLHGTLSLPGTAIKWSCPWRLRKVVPWSGCGTRQMSLYPRKCSSPEDRDQ